MNSTVLLCKNKVLNLVINMQPIPVSILFSLFIASSVVCNEQSPELNLQGNVHGRHFLNPSKITSNVVSSVSSNAAKGIGGVANQAADTETKLGNAVSSGINGVGKLASAGSNGDADAVEFFAKMKGDAVRAIGDIAAYNGNRTSADIKRAGRMANCILSELGLAPLGSFVKDATNQLGDVESVIGSVVDEEFDTLGAFVAGEEIGNKINTSISVKVVKQLGDAISSGINGVGELASSGSNMTASVAQSLLGDELGSAIGQGINGLGPLTPGLASLVNLVSVFASKIGSAADKKFDALGDLNVVGGKAIGNKIKGLGSAVENGFKAAGSVGDMDFGLKANAIKVVGNVNESLTNDSGKAAGAKGESLSDEASKAGQIAESAVKAAIGAAIKVSGNVDSAVGAITDGASKAGEMASNGVKAAGDAAGKAVGALTGAFSSLFG